MNEPDHERLRRELESAATESRAEAGDRRVVTGKQAMIGLLAAVPIAAAVIAAITASQSGSPSEPAPATPVGEPPSEPAVPPPPSPGPTTPRPPTTPTGPDVPPQPERPNAQPPQPGPPPDANRPVTHTVRQGETLARIALRYQVSLEQIAEQNAIADPDRIQAGDDLEIRPAPPNEIVIPAGATLTGLASRHGVTVSHLIRLNPHVIDPDRIVAGGRLRIS
ncbi:LysM peptidoglycan-binding domain-containing protein [Pseudonocardia sp. DSM 110487]|uniref:LysM peptidoglycan-binding domain-containing protein n=1 Tax=Pseudonocardia sp. DSM 110487 TaxID=2865833 RepID=UPI001C6A7896|nr:LysM peptidoglycan-binding domain-containing protein [Pseudonocardia sp. DSM 110487]QYN32004.1 LysM peptidoglycan-binding domain-containing protein [Pseudonocardia sp. DSM 110487]